MKKSIFAILLLLTFFLNDPVEEESLRYLCWKYGKDKDAGHCEVKQKVEKAN